MIPTHTVLKVLRVIQGHPKHDPITGHALAEMFGLPLRTVQTIAEQLRAAGHKVGSSMRPPLGYFLAHTPEEMSETVEQYRIRSRHFALTANKLSDWGSLAPTVFEQQEEAV